MRQLGILIQQRFFRIALYAIVFNVAILLFYPPAHFLSYVITGNALGLLVMVILEHALTHFRPDRFTVISIFLTVVVGLIALHPVMTKGGWPNAHEQYFWKDRVVTYYLHFLQLDFFPLWSAEDCYGMGSPRPLYYHKIFWQITAGMYMFIGSLKDSIVVSLLLTEILGIYGLYRCLRTLKVERYASLFVALILPFMNYSFTDWFIRGAMPEFMALNLIPYLVLWCIHLIQKKHFSFFIVPILTGLYLAHNIIAYYAVFVILLSVLIALVSNYTRKFFIQLLWKGLISGLAFIAILSIYFVPMLLISDDFNPEKVKVGFDIVERMEDFGQYFLDTDYIWGRTWFHISPEINLIFSAFFIFLSLIFFYQEVIQNKGKTLIVKLKKPVSVFLIIATLFFFYLQLPVSAWFYYSVPGADFIQFAWRLLAFIQVFLLISFGLILSKIFTQRQMTQYTSGLLLFVMVLNYPFLKKLDPEVWEWTSREEVESIKNRGIWGIGGEYISIVAGIESMDVEWYKKLARKGAITEEGCEVRILYWVHEGLIRRYSVVSSHESQVILPICYSGLEKVVLHSPDESVELKASRPADDPRIHLTIPPGTYKLEIHLPSWKTIL